MSINNFYDLDTWKKARKLTLHIYIITKDFPTDEKYGLISQMRRASSSIGANIAEGFERYHFKDKIRFYYQARRSIAEIQNFLLLAKDLKFTEQTDFIKLGLITKDSFRLLNGLIRSTEKINKKLVTSYSLLVIIFMHPQIDSNKRKIIWK